jgi:aspartyl-tRNA(Asn)/glutamyl-tRNA(Gln) amidotransferase subunit C
MVCKADYLKIVLTEGNVGVFARLFGTINVTMSKLTREDVLKLARLARLDLKEEEVKEFTQELTEILQYVEQLQDVDVKGLKPTNQITGLENVVRADEVKDYGYDEDVLLENLPDKQDRQIKVKRMIG